MIKIRVLALCVGVFGVITQQPDLAAQAVPSLGFQLAVNGVDELRTWDRFVETERNAGNLRLRAARYDPDRPERLIERLDQQHDGVPIWGGQVVRQSERGVPLWIFGSLSADPEIAVEPALTMTAARAKLQEAADAALVTDPQLTILPLTRGGYALSYHAVAATGDIARIFIDADTGAELWRFSELRFQSAVGSGVGVLGDTKKLSVQQQSGVYVASDTHRPPTIQTFDMAGNLNRTKLMLLGGPLAPSDLASDTDNTWTDPAVVDAHAYIAWTYDFFFKRFGRHGLDDRDRPVLGVVNPVTQQGALTLNINDAGTFALNAFWCPVCGPNQIGMMVFGSGIPANFSYQSQTYNQFAGGLDIVAHELTHAVTTSSSNLIGSNESGALNEAFSDMMGTSAEFFYRDLNAYKPAADYIVGEDVIRGVRGAPDGVRSMSNPSAYGDPDHYRNKFTGQGDNGGLHTNAGIPNQAFYLAIEGGTNRTSGLSVTGVGAANREQVEKAFYRAFTLMLPANATFVTARGATTQAARDLYGAGSRAESAIDQAWTAVGVPDPRTIGTFTGSVGALTQTSTAFTMNATGTYQINLRGNASDLDLDLYLTPNTSVCSQWPIPASCVLRGSITPEAVESVKYPVRINESYRIWIDNLGRRSSTFTIEHFITQ